MIVLPVVKEIEVCRHCVRFASTTYEILAVASLASVPYIIRYVIFAPYSYTKEQRTRC